MRIKLDCFIKFFLKGNYIWNEKNVAGGSSKIWLTGLAAGNMAWGGGLSMLVIGKSQKPRWFKGTKCLLCLYWAQNKSWMSSETFE